MNERHLFRGVAKVNKQFVIGWLDLDIDLEEDNNEMSIRPVDGIMRYVIIQNTVGQCTGLKDKNGKLIFEGDKIAVTWKGEEKDETENVIVEDIRNLPKMFGSNIRHCEIIGNIHEEEAK